ncbi:MAG: hypothetical protein ABJO38_04995 [Stappiaceae bacterium]
MSSPEKYAGERQMQLRRKKSINALTFILLGALMLAAAGPIQSSHPLAMSLFNFDLMAMVGSNQPY